MSPAKWHRRLRGAAQGHLVHNLTLTPVTDIVIINASQAQGHRYQEPGQGVLPSLWFPGGITAANFRDRSEAALAVLWKVVKAHAPRSSGLTP